MTMKHLAYGFALLSFALSNVAQALVMYDSDASSRFELLSDGGMAISYSPGMEPPMTATTGTGIASVDADRVEEVDADVWEMDSEVSGSADAPAGTSIATVLNGILVTLDNSGGTGAATASFKFSYSWLASVSRTTPARETAFASPFFHLTGFSPSGDETLMIDAGMGAMAMSEWLVNPFSGLDFGGTDLTAGSSGSESVTAYVTVPEGNIDSFSVITDSSGAAAHIPEPATVMLLLFGLAGLIGTRGHGGAILTQHAFALVRR